MRGWFPPNLNLGTINRYVLLTFQKSGELTPLRLLVYPIIFKVWDTSQVVYCWDSFHQQYDGFFLCKWSCFTAIQPYDQLSSSIYPHSWCFFIPGWFLVIEIASNLPQKPDPPRKMQKKNSRNTLLGGGFKDLSCSSRSFGEMIQFHLPIFFKTTNGRLSCKGHVSSLQQQVGCFVVF